MFAVHRFLVPVSSPGIASLAWFAHGSAQFLLRCSVNRHASHTPFGLPPLRSDRPAEQRLGPAFSIASRQGLRRCCCWVSLDSGSLNGHRDNCSCSRSIGCDAHGFLETCARWRPWLSWILVDPRIRIMRLSIPKPGPIVCQCACWLQFGTDLPVAASQSRRLSPAPSETLHTPAEGPRARCCAALQTASSVVNIDADRTCPGSTASPPIRFSHPVKV